MPSAVFCLQVEVFRAVADALGWQPGQFYLRCMDWTPMVRSCLAYAPALRDESPGIATSPGPQTTKQCLLCI